MAEGFVCPACRKYVAQSLDAGQQSACPFCGQTVVMEQPQQQSHIFCAKCGERNDENNYKCTACGFVLRGRQQYVVTSEEGFGGLVPYKNAQALWAYYLGIFSLIPCLGLPLGIAAIILGIKGVRNARQQPQVRGKVHAIIGIVLGGLCLLGYLLVAVLAAIGIIQGD